MIQGSIYRSHNTPQLVRYVLNTLQTHDKIHDTFWGKTAPFGGGIGTILEFFRTYFGICGPELETPVRNLRVEFCSQFNEIAISDNEGLWLAFFAPGNQKSEARAALDRSSVLMRRPARAGRKDAPPPQIHTRRCALAQPPRRSWPPRRWDQLLVRHGSRAAACGRLVSNLGCTSGRTTFREQPARHPAR